MNDINNKKNFKIDKYYKKNNRLSIGIIADILKIISSNLIILIVSIVSGIFIPKFLGIENYAIYQTFGLYVGYVGILHFGFVDGLYIKYGGINRKDIPKDQLKSEMLFLLFSQLIITSLGVIIIITGYDIKIIIPICIAILPTNMITFYNFLYQATGSFNEYAKLNTIQPILKLVAIIIIIFLLKQNSPYLFINANLFILYFIFLVLFYNSFYNLKDIKSAKIFTAKNINNITIGIFIMLGNLSTMLFYSMDRWFVKIFLTNIDFAYYSFAVSMMGLVIMLINSIAMAFYPFLAKVGENKNILTIIYKYLIILSSTSSGIFFLFKFAVYKFLPNYILSLNIISILFAGLPAISVINAIYINLYKIKKLERKYFFIVISMAIVSFIFNSIAILIYKSNWTIAIATTLTFYFWFFYSLNSFESIKINIKDIIYLGFFIIVFYLTTSFINNWVIGLFTFFIIIMSINYLLYKEIVKDMILRIRYISINKLIKI
jgi:O-antigen/teichoic acid export membrane protein